MTHTAAPTAAISHDNRPAAFDAILLECMPRLKKYARRLTETADEAESALSDMTVAILANWRSYREDGNFEKWCKLTIRSKAHAARTAAAKYEHVDIQDAELSYPAQQEKAAIVSSALRVISSAPCGSEELMLYAVGHSQNAVGRMIGLTGSRVCQRIKAAREHLRAAA